MSDPASRSSPHPPPAAAAGRPPSPPGFLTRLRRFAGKLLRRLLGRRTVEELTFDPQADPVAYAAWLAAHRKSRDAGPRPRPPVPAGRFSVLTSAYDTPAEFLLAAAESVRAQTARDFEWVLLDNGSSRADTRQALAEIAAADPRVRLIRVDDNRGIIGGMRECLAAATGEYVVPLDSDDLLVDDALATFSAEIDAPRPGDADRPEFLFADEDMLIGGVPRAPYLRPGWDPVLNLCTSYIFHPCCFRRAKAVELGVYSDDGPNYCHDWDTVCRFAGAGLAPHHIPAVLYHWRQHPTSATHKAGDPTPNLPSMLSQEWLLRRELERRGLSDLFDVDPSPIWRGAPEWALIRRRVNPPTVSLVWWGEGKPPEMTGGAGGPGGYPFAASIHIDGIRRLGEAVAGLPRGYIALVSDAVRPEGEGWVWEAVGLIELHGGAVDAVAGRLLTTDRRVVGIGRTAGLVRCPDAGRSADDPGVFAVALKSRRVDGHDPRFVVFAPSAAARITPDAPLPPSVDVAVSPSVSGTLLRDAPVPAPAETLPGPRFYSPLWSRLPGAGYRLLWV